MGCLFVHLVGGPFCGLKKVHLKVENLFSFSSFFYPQLKQKIVITAIPQSSDTNKRKKRNITENKKLFLLPENNFFWDIDKVKKFLPLITT